MSKMSLSNAIVGILDRSQRLVVHGPNGVGKSTFASQAPNAIFICAEDGTSHLDVTRFPAPDNWQDILDAIGVLYEQQHEYKTVILDSADWAEQMARDAICVENNVSSIEKIPYGKGWVFCQEKFSQLLKCFDALYAKGMNIIIVAHTTVKAFNDPEHETYDRYSLKLDKRNDALLREWSDYVLFANWDTRINQKTDKMGNPLPGLEGKAKAKSFGKRLLFTQRSAAFDAKQRFAIPERLPLDWNAFWQAHSECTRQNKSQSVTSPTKPTNQTNQTVKELKQ